MTRDSSAAVQPTTATVSSSTIKETVAASGTVEPARSADLDFEVAGTVTNVYVAEGDRVSKGQARRWPRGWCAVPGRQADHHGPVTV